jgi:exopolyphosphatase/guanosine-5'-triphosphate,3'-diphosphate pyrophosphatase
VLRLAERVGRDGTLEKDAADDLVQAVASARAAAARHEVDDMLAFATSAVREVTNSAKLLTRVRDSTGVDLQVLSGREEARLTFLAVRRWFGWSSGRLLVLDIGGGSLEIAAGVDEEPGVALSLPLGAGRLTRDRFSTDPPPAVEVDDLRDHAARHLESVVTGEPARDGITLGDWDRVAATSKTFRSLARLAGAAPSGAGFRTPRSLTREGLHQVLGFIRRMPSAALAQMDGVSPERAHQLLAGAVVAEQVMRRLGLDRVDICPWALREGVILRRLDTFASA